MQVVGPLRERSLEGPDELCYLGLKFTPRVCVLWRDGVSLARSPATPPPTVTRSKGLGGALIINVTGTLTEICMLCSEARVDASKRTRHFLYSDVRRVSSEHLARAVPGMKEAAVRVSECQ